MLKVAPAPMREVADNPLEGGFVPPPVPLPSLLDPVDISYERLFGIAAQPMLIVDPRNRIQRVNLAAERVLCASSRILIGAPLKAAFSPSSAAGLAAALATARLTGKARLVGSPARAAAAQLSCALSLVVAEGGASILVHLDAGHHGSQGSPSAAGEAIESASCALLLTDAHWRVEYANHAFLQMAEVNSLTEVQAQPLARWLVLSAENFAQLREQMSSRRAVSMLWLRMAREHGADLHVEVSAVAVPHADRHYWGFSIRSLARFS